MGNIAKEIIPIQVVEAMERLIDQIALPQGLRALSVLELRQVADELRDELIDTVSGCGGHFASSLGVTEISVALHHMFNTPTDRLIWDVGHQAYVHKMLTGRRDQLATIRQKDGLSGFLKREESEYDTFGAGHAGTSISAATGISSVLLREDPEAYTTTVIGDASITSGMAFEALNHAGMLQLPRFIVVLNDNEMSISKNVGAISWLFSRAVTSRTSTMARNHFKRLYSMGYVPELLYKVLDRAEEVTQNFFASASMLFESFGFRYIGPIDGHNIEDLVKALTHAKQQDVPVLVHCHTIKGKGYEPAEEDPIKWHGVKPFDRRRGEFISKQRGESRIPPTYTNVFAESLVEQARENDKIIGITAAMPTGTGLDLLERELPKQFYDVGICEQHAVTFAAGLACEGYRPVVAIYSTFLQRAFDQIIHDVCIQNLPVVFAIDRAGVVGNDGETHQGVFDLGYLRIIPNLVVLSPKDENELRHMLYTALNHDGPIAIRYPRGTGLGVQLDSRYQTIPIGRCEVCKRGKDVVLIGLGPTVQQALEAARQLEKQGVRATVVNARSVKPLDTEILAEELKRHELAVTIEDHALLGGLGSALSELVQDRGLALRQPLIRLGVGDSFIPHASQAEQMQLMQYDAANIAERVLESIPRQIVAATA